MPSILKGRRLNKETLYVFGLAKKVVTMMDNPVEIKEAKLVLECLDAALQEQMLTTGQVSIANFGTLLFKEREMAGGFDILTGENRVGTRRFVRIKFMPSARVFKLLEIAGKRKVKKTGKGKLPGGGKRGRKRKVAERVDLEGGMV